MPKRSCSVCSETGGLLFWSPHINSWYCPSCYQPDACDVPERDISLLETLAQVTGDLRRLRETHARLVHAAWPVVGEDEMLSVLGGTQWGRALKNTLWQIRELRS